MIKINAAQLINAMHTMDHEDQILFLNKLDYENSKDIVFLLNSQEKFADAMLIFSNGGWISGEL